MRHALTRTFAILFFSLFYGSAGLWAERLVDETRPLRADGRLSVELVSGSVTITGWDRNEVHITGTLGDDVEGLEIDGSGSRLEIEVRLPDDRHHRRGGRRDYDADLTLMVPAGAELEVEIVHGPITATGLTGSGEFACVDGSISISGAMRHVEAETVNGSVEIEGSGTAVEAATVNGTIKVRGAADTVEATTVNGRIDVSAGQARHIELETVSGDITFSGALAPNANLEAEAHSGSVILELPAATSARFEVETFSGEIINDFGPSAVRTGQYAPGKYLEFATGSGDAVVEVESFSGRVELRKKG